MIGKAPKMLDVEMKRSNFSRGITFDQYLNLKKVYTSGVIPIYENGIKVAEIKFRKYASPLNYYDFTSIKVVEEFKGQSSDTTMGVGSTVVSGITIFLQRKKAFGILHNSVEWEMNNNKKEVFKLYWNKGWRYIDPFTTSGMGSMYFSGGEDLNSFKSRIKMIKDMGKRVR